VIRRSEEAPTDRGVRAAVEARDGAPERRVGIPSLLAILRS
jgi:hypothetical protein